MHRPLRAPFFFVFLVFSAVSGASPLAAQIVRGRVVDADGKPHAGARLELVARDFTTAGSGVVNPAVTKARTTSRGHFAFDASGMVPHVEYSLFVISDRCEDAQISGLRRPAGREFDVGSIRLERGQPLRGTVADAAGKPLAGATVRFWPTASRTTARTAAPQPLFPMDALLARERIDGWVATTDAKGAYRFAGLPAGPGEILVTKPGSAAVSRPVAPGGDPIEGVVLDPGSVMRGRLTEQDGKPIARGRVTSQSFVSGGTIPLSARTDAQGKFELVGVRARARSVRVMASAAAGHGSKAFRLRRGKEVTSALVGAPRLKIRVLGPDGKPVARFAARSLVPNDISAYSAFEWARVVDGVGSIRSRGGTFCQVEVRVPGHAPVTSEPMRFDDPDNVLEVELAAGGGVRGRVVDVEGQPVAEARVSLYAIPRRRSVPNPFFRALPQRSGIITQGVSDDAGRFVIPKLEARRYRVVVTHGEHAEFAEEVAVEDGEEFDCKAIRLPRGVQVRGRVVQDGKPVAGAQVVLVSSVGTTVFADSDAEGRFIVSTRIAKGIWYALAVREARILQWATSTAPRTGKQVKLEGDGNQLELTVTAGPGFR